MSSKAASKSVSKFALKKKTAAKIVTKPVTGSTATDQTKENNVEPTKSILKGNKAEDLNNLLVDKKVKFQLKKNQTQLFNKTLKIAEKQIGKPNTPPIEKVVEETTTPIKPIEKVVVVEEPTKPEPIKEVLEKKKPKKVEVESDSSSSDSSDSSSDEKVVLKKDKKKDTNNTISGFIILPVSIENSPFKKYIYYKKETNKKWPQNKTLFATNLPTNCTTLEDVQKLFKYDFIESVHFGQPLFNQNQTGFEDEEQPQEPQIDESTKHVAHIIMKDQDSLNLFLKKSSSLSIQQPSLQLNGFDQMMNQYNSNIIRDFDSLQTKLDNIMIDYDKRVLETKKRSKQRQVPDEEGFITVGPSSAKVMTAEEVKAMLEKKTKKNFYAFQHRQNKKDELDVLRQKFEEDKQKISKITAARKFKPY